MLQTYKTACSKKTKLTSDVFIFHFDLPESQTLDFIPGQYMIMSVADPAGVIVKRLYSIASPNTKHHGFELMVKLIPGGKAGQFLSGLQEQASVEFQGPAGLFVLRESPRSKIFLTTGTGIAPVLSMLRSRVTGGSKQLLLWGLPYYQDVCLFEELKGFKNDPSLNFDFKICLSREKNLDMISVQDRNLFLLGRVTSGLEQTAENDNLILSSNDYYLCSGREIIDSLKEFLVSKDVPKEQVFFEKF